MSRIAWKYRSLWLSNPFYVLGVLFL